MIFSGPFYEVDCSCVSSNNASISPIIILDYFYTEKQVAELLNVNRITVWRWINSGKFNTTARRS